LVGGKEKERKKGKRKELWKKRDVDRKGRWVWMNRAVRGCWVNEYSTKLSPLLRFSFPSSLLLWLSVYI
jgi:hypothetical protein